MSKTFPVYGHDAHVSGWAFYEWGCKPFPVDMAVGVASAETGKLAGAFTFTRAADGEAEVRFIGPGTLSRRILREIFACAAHVLKLDRLTVRTSKPYIARGLAKLGAVHEGQQQHDDIKVERFAFPRERIEILAGMKG